MMRNQVEVGGLVIKVRKLRRVAGSKPAEYETIELPKEKHRIGHVLKGANNHAAQMTVFCDRGVKYWFVKDCEPI